MWKESSWELMKGRYALVNLLIIYIFFLKNGLTDTHKLKPGQCYNPWLQNNVTCVCPILLSPAGLEQRGQAAGHTHTHVCYNFAANVQIMGVDVSHHLVVRGGNKIDEK